MRAILVLCGVIGCGVPGGANVQASALVGDRQGCARGDCPPNQYCDLERSPAACVPGCTATEPCLGGYTCVGAAQTGVGLCVAGCYRDSDCPPDRVCTGGADVRGQCVAKTLGQPCTSSDDCGYATACDRATGKCVQGCHEGNDPGWFEGEAECNQPYSHCENERCVLGCAVGACPAGQRCDTTLAIPACVGGCTQRESCEAGQTCFRPVASSDVGTCISGCTADTDCGHQQRCTIAPGRWLGTCTCIDDEACVLGQLCVAGADNLRRCVPGCRRCADCDRDHRCDGLSGFDVSPRGCPDGLICNGTDRSVVGQCVAVECLFPSDCPAGTYCQPAWHRCVAPEDVYPSTDACPYGTYHDAASNSCRPGCGADSDCASYVQQFREVECVAGSSCNLYTHSCQGAPFAAGTSETDNGFDPFTGGAVHLYDDASCGDFVSAVTDTCIGGFKLDGEDPAFPRDLDEAVGQGSPACDHSGRGPTTEPVSCTLLCRDTMPDDAISTDERYDGGLCVTDPEPRNAGRCQCHRWRSADDTEPTFDPMVGGCVLVYTGSACSGDVFERFCDECLPQTRPLAPDLLERGVKGCVEHDGEDWPAAFEQRRVDCRLECLTIGKPGGRCQTVSVNGFSAAKCVCD